MKKRDWKKCMCGVVVRSEEHTSELQSRTNLVCRLLLEKKKNKKIKISHFSVSKMTSVVTPLQMR